MVTTFKDAMGEIFAPLLIGRKKMSALFEKVRELQDRSEALQTQADILEDLDYDIDTVYDSIEKEKPEAADYLLDSFSQAAKLPKDLMVMAMEELVPAHQALIRAHKEADQKGVA